MIEPQFLRSATRVLLGVGLVFAGAAHFTSTSAFLAQVPNWIPWPREVIYLSGVMEVVLGLALLLVRRKRHVVGWATAAFFLAIFPGNISQWLNGIDAFGLDSDQARLTRLFFQPVLVLAAVWSTRPAASRRPGGRGHPFG